MKGEKLSLVERVLRARLCLMVNGSKVRPSILTIVIESYVPSGQKKALILLHPHSKTVLEEGISGDAEFLSSANIMDYSCVDIQLRRYRLTNILRLLLGVDSEQKQIACGLVDTIGSYTFAKTLEYKAKQNIKKNVTVIPPNEYRDRFVKAINSYFVACPGTSNKHKEHLS